MCCDETTFKQQSSLTCPSTETCDSYNKTSGIYQVSVPCPVERRFCCGTCDNRFCCDQQSQRLDQTLCIDLDICLSYSYANGSIVNPKICGRPPFPALYCCGSCNNRFCCNNFNEKLNQNECKYYIQSTQTSKTSQAPNLSYILMYF